MKKLLFAILLISSSTWAVNPAPNSKTPGFMFGALVRGGYPHPTSMQNFLANNFGLIESWGDSGANAYMHSVNPNLKIGLYQIYLLNEADTQDVRAWCNSNAVNYDSMFILTGATAADSSRVRFTNFTADFGDEFRTTAGGGKPVRVNGYFAQTRVLWDFRNKNVGIYLAYRYNTALNAIDADFVMMDEWSHIRGTGTNNAGLWVNGYPMRDSISDWWTTNFRNIARPWSASMNVTQIRDSLYALMGTEGQFLDTLYDLMAAQGHFLIVNPSADYGPYTSANNFSAEGRHLMNASFRGMMMGEYCGYTPARDGTPGQTATILTNAVNGCLTLADSGGCEVFLWPVLTGYQDSCFADTFTIKNTVKSALGFGLDCFAPAVNITVGVRTLIKVDWGYEGSLSAARTCASDTFPWQVTPLSVRDSTTTWMIGAGKYFGVPNTTRTTASGTDQAGQSYTMRSFCLKTVGGDTLTLVVRRNPNGSNRKPWGSRASYTLPSYTSSSGDAWAELNEDGTWTTGKLEGDTIGVRNAGCRIFSTNTALADAGIGDTSITVQSSTSQNEGNSGTSTVYVRVSQTSTRSVNTTFLYSTANVSASSGSDYVAVSGATGTIVAGQLFVDLPITINGDTDLESDEVLTVTISSPSSNVSLGGTTVCSLTILNDDSAPSTSGAAITYRGYIIQSGNVISKGAP